MYHMSNPIHWHANMILFLASVIFHGYQGMFFCLVPRNLGPSHVGLQSGILATCQECGRITKVSGIFNEYFCFVCNVYFLSYINTKLFCTSFEDLGQFATQLQQVRACIARPTRVLRQIYIQNSTEQKKTRFSYGKSCR